MNVRAWRTVSSGIENPAALADFNSACAAKVLNANAEAVVAQKLRLEIKSPSCRPLL